AKRMKNQDKRFEKRGKRQAATTARADDSRNVRSGPNLAMARGANGPTRTPAVAGIAAKSPFHDGSKPRLSALRAISDGKNPSWRPMHGGVDRTRMTLRHRTARVSDRPFSTVSRAAIVSSPQARSIS